MAEDPWVNPSRDDEAVRQAQIDAAREQAEAARAIRAAEGRKSVGDIFSAGKDKAKQNAKAAAAAMKRAASAEGMAKGAMGAAKVTGKAGGSAAGGVYNMMGRPAQGGGINAFFWIAFITNLLVLGIGISASTLVVYFFLAVLGWLMVFKRGAPILSKTSLQGLLESGMLAAVAYAWPVLLAMVPFLNERVARIIAVAFPFYLLFFVFAQPVTPHLQKLEKMYAIILVILLLAYGTIAIYSGDAVIAGLPNVTYDVRSGLLDFWDVIWEAIQIIIAEMQKITDLAISLATQRIDYATGGQLTAGQVDPNAEQDLGVRYTKIETTQKEFYDDEPVAVYAVIAADTLDEPIRMNIKCVANYDKDPQPEDEDKNIMADSIVPSYLMIDQKDTQDIDCGYNAGTLPIGSHQLSVFVKYDFLTTAKQKAYFVDEDRARALQRNDIDILDEYGITDKNPTAVYTNGPVMVGLGFRALPIRISTGMNEPSTLDVSIQNRWQGKILGINSLAIKIPSSMSIKDAMCSNYQFSVSSEGTLKVYTLQDPGQIKEFEPYRTFRCPIEFDNVEDILGSGPVVTRFFHVEADYEYQMEKKKSVRVLNSTLYRES